MTLLVRDEIDIVEKNINFHLASGVDYIIATDNDSKDGTREILLKYKRKGLLHLIDEKGRDHSQSKWVNRMAKIAVEIYKADIVFHCDADEFWSPEKGDLKNELWKSKCDFMNVNLKNVLLEDRGGREKFPYDVRYAIARPIVAKNLRKESKRKNLYFFQYPQKVIFKTDKFFLKVGEGNHGIIEGNNYTKSVSQNIIIYHFPLRGKDIFFDKVKRGGKALKENKCLDKNVGWHWRRWYSAYENGVLDLEYKKLILSKEEIRKMKSKGIIEDFNFNDFLNK